MKGCSFFYVYFYMGNKRLIRDMANNDNLQPAKKGEVKNPNGRPKGSKNRSTIVKELLELVQSTSNPITKESGEFTQTELMTMAMINKAKDGDVNAYKELMDSGYGKNADNLNISDDKRSKEDLFPTDDELNEA